MALTNLTLRNPDEPQAVSFKTGEPLTISLRYAAAKPLPNVEFELRYYSADGKTRIASPRTGEHREPLHLKPPGGVIEFTCACTAAEAWQLRHRGRGPRRRDLEDSRVVGRRDPTVRPNRPGH